MSKKQYERLEYVDVGETRIACHRIGAGPQIICLHATGHSARDFVQLANNLKDKYEFIALDWPAHGESASDNGGVNASRYAEILLAVVTELDLKDYTILGNSIGGAAAIIHAASHQHQIKSLVLCNTGGLQPVNWIAKAYCKHMGTFFAKREAENFMGKFKKYYEKTILPTPAAAWRRDEIIGHGYEMAPVLSQAWFGFAQSGADIRDLMPSLNLPIFYAWAKNDKAIAWKRSRRAALSAPNTRVEMFKGGHCAFLEDPAVFEKSFTAFLEGTN